MEHVISEHDAKYITNTDNSHFKWSHDTNVTDIINSIIGSNNNIYQIDSSTEDVLGFKTDTIRSFFREISLEFGKIKSDNSYPVVSDEINTNTLHPKLEEMLSFDDGLIDKKIIFVEGNVGIGKSYYICKNFTNNKYMINTEPLKEWQNFYVYTNKQNTLIMHRQ